ncbi:unnamed protein product, partial [marine sediment metagenome]
EPLSCATHAVIEQANLLSHETVLVLGPGPLGLLTAQIAKSLGARVIICGIKVASAVTVIPKGVAAK